MRNAVHCPVIRLARQIVEHQHGRSAAREIVLKREDLAAVAERGLREQAYLRQAVENNPVGFEALNRVEDLRRGSGRV